MDYAEFFGATSEEPDKDIVAVHGLYDSNKEPWKDASGSRPKWLERELFEKSKARVIVFNYEADLAGEVIFTRTGINALAQKLLKALKQWREGADASNRPLAFVVHDFGGTIVKRALVLAWNHQDLYGDILHAIYAMVFIGCPHRPASCESLIDSIVSLISFGPERPRFGLTRTAKMSALTIQETNDLFLETGILLQAQIASVYSDIWNYKTQVFDNTTATLGLSSEKRVSSANPHQTLVCYEDGKKTYPELRKILELGQNDDETALAPIWPISPYPAGLHLILSSAIPVRLSFMKANDREIEQILPSNKFAEWLKGGSRNVFLSRLSDGKLPLDGFIRFLQTRADELKIKMTLFSFQFRKEDPRCSSTRSALSSFLAQAFHFLIPRSEPDKRPPELLKRLQKTDQYTEDELFSLFEAANFWLMEKRTRVVWAVWNLDECSGSQSDFAGKLANCCRFSELRPAIVFAGSQDKNFLAAMERADVQRLADVDFISARSLQQISVDFELLKTHATNHVFQEKLEEQSSLVAGDEALRNILLRWFSESVDIIRKGQSPVPIAASASASEPQNLIFAILGSLSDRQRKWTKTALRWIMFSARPLSPLELALLLEFENAMLESDFAVSDEVINLYFSKSIDKSAGGISDFSDRSHEIVTTIHDWLFGLIRIENNEVSFGHPKLLSTLSTLDVANSFWYIGETESHLHILQEVLLLLKHASVHSSPIQPMEHISDSHHSLIHYATQYWPTHYKMAEKNTDNLTTKGREQAFLNDFLANNATTKFWLNAKGEEGLAALATSLGSEENNRYTYTSVLDKYGYVIGWIVSLIWREVREPYSGLAVLARCGFRMSEIGGLLSIPGWQSNKSMVHLALTGAIAGHHESLVNELPIASLEESKVREIFVLSAKSGNAKIMGRVFELAPRPEVIPQVFLSRAAQVGEMNSISAACNDHTLIEDHFGEILVESIRYHRNAITKQIAQSGMFSDEDLEQALIEACRLGDKEQIKTLLELREGLWKIREYLPLACQRGNHLAVKELLGSYPIDDAPFLHLKRDWSVLAECVSMGLLESARIILDHVDLDHKDVQQGLRLAFTEGVAAQQVNACSLLLKKKPKLLNGAYGTEVIFKAVTTGNVELVRLIFNNGVNANCKSNIGLTPLSTAASKGMTAMVEAILEYADVDAITGNGLTALYSACTNDQVEVVELLLNRKADLRLTTNARNWSPLEGAFNLKRTLNALVSHHPPPDFRRVITMGGKPSSTATALYLACRANEVECVKLLLQGDPDLEFTRSYEDKKNAEQNFTPLTIAAEKGCPEVAKLLLDKGASVYHRVRGEFPILHFITHEETLRVVLEYHPNLEAKDNSGFTALHNRCRFNNKKVPLSFLARMVNAGADLETTNDGFQTILGAAAAADRVEYMKLFISKGAKVNSAVGKWGTPLIRACRNNKAAAVRFLVENGADVNLIHPVKGPALQVAGCAGTARAEMVDYLLDKGADINSAGSIYSTIIGEACLRSDLDSVKYLLDREADVSKRARNGMPSTMIPCYRQDGTLDMLKELNTRGALDVDLTDVLGRTIFHCAVQTGNVELVEYLYTQAPRLMQVLDSQGWSALHWATRRSYPVVKYNRSPLVTWEKQVEVIRYLLKNNCPGLEDSVPYTSVHSRDWSAAKLARFHGAPEDVLKLLTPAAESDKGNSDPSSDQSNPDQSNPDQSKSTNLEDLGPVGGDVGTWSCDACYSYVVSAVHICQEVECQKDFGLCEKCIDYKDAVHDPAHKFELKVAAKEHTEAGADPQ